ncbi:potassium-transporting ATPase subunit F [Streptococcus suis]
MGGVCVLIIIVYLFVVVFQSEY